MKEIINVYANSYLPNAQVYDSNGRKKEEKRREEDVTNAACLLGLFFLKKPRRNFIICIASGPNTGLRIRHRPSSGIFGLHRWEFFLGDHREQGIMSIHGFLHSFSGSLQLLARLLG